MPPPSELEDEVAHVLAEDADDPQGRSGKRPKASDYSTTIKNTIILACSHFRCLVVTESAFPDQPESDEMAASSWYHACEDVGITAPITEGKLRIVQ